MHRNPQARHLITIILLCFCAVSCVSDAVQLNSERIARKFGNYHLEIIENKENIRVSNLYSMGPAGKVCRTFAVVGLSEDIDTSFAAEHATILDGGSIGAVFRLNGWGIEKRHLYIGELRIGSQAIRLTRLMHVKAPARLAVHIYVLAVSKNGSSFDYAMLAEVHHPEYLTMTDLWSLYGGEFSGDEARKEAGQILHLVRGKFRDAWTSG